MTRRIRVRSGPIPRKITPPASAAAAVGGTNLTTKGDLHGYGSSNTRIPVGINTQVLTVDSTQALGLKWAAGGGTLTQYEDIAAGTVSNLEVSSISNGGKDLLVTAVLRSDRSGSTNDTLEINVGNTTIDTGSNYRWFSVFDGSSEGESASESDTKLSQPSGVPGADADSGNFATLEMRILDYAATTREKFFTLNLRHYRATEYFTMDSWGRWESNSAIDIVRLTPTNGDWVADSLMRITEL